MGEFFPVPGISESAFHNGLVVVPSVSLANLPQLAADLLITSLGLKRVGWIGRGDTVVPFAGAGEDGEGIVIGGLEGPLVHFVAVTKLYGKPDSEIFVIQQRSPTLKSRKDAHIALLHDFLISHEFSFILILASLDAASQDDAQLLTPHQHIVPPSSSSSSPHFERLRLLPPLSLQLSDAPRTWSTSVPYPPFLPAAGLTRRLLVSLQDSDKSPSHGAVSAWCVEGDNRGDAHALALVVLAILNLEGTEITEPRSWAGLFGAREGGSGGLRNDAELYG